MENINMNDWFATRLLNPDKGIDFILSEGINSQNSELKDRDFYKNKAKVQELFKKEDGNLDEDAFNTFYDNISKEYSYLNALDTENFVLNAYEKSESNFSTNFGVINSPEIEVSQIKNPLNQSQGISTLGNISSPTISKREAAQQNRYWDNELQKWSDKTVNDEGVIGLLSNKPLVYAIWDEDGEHIDKLSGKKVKHFAGEWKTDEFGNFYTETWVDKDSTGKQFVSLSEVVTDDTSPWNKIDIFDSDSLEQNIPRTLLKAAAVGAATLIAPQAVASTLFYSTAAINLARVLPQVSKSLLAFFGSDSMDRLNKWDNTMRRFGRSTSDYSQEHFLSLENILNMAIDSYMQLGQQRAIAMIPQTFSSTKKAGQQIEIASRLSSLKLLSQGQTSEKMLQALTKSTSMYRDAEKILNNATKVSSAISRAYLVATSVEDVYNQAKLYGFDNQTAGVISLAVYAFMGKLFQSDYFRSILYNTPDYELARDIRVLSKKYLQNNAKSIAKDLSTGTSPESKKNALKKIGDNLTNFFNNKVINNELGRYSILQGAVAEGVEETMEEIAQDISYQIGQSWQSLKEVFVDKKYNNSYNYLETNPLSRYGSSFFGGALGGAVFKIADRMKFDKAAYNNWKSILGGDNSKIMNELVTYISQGKKDLILKEIDKLERSPMLSSTISAFTGEATTNTTESQNAVLFGSLRKAINDIDSFLNQDGLKIDKDKFGDIEVVKGLRAAWLVDKGLSNSLYEDYQNRITEIVNIKGEIQELSTKLSDKATDEEKSEVNENIGKLKNILNFKLGEVKKLLNGEDDSYLGRLMLSTNKNTILDKIMPVTKEALAKNLYNLDYKELPKSYQTIVDNKLKNLSNSGELEINYISAWNVYKNMASADKIKSRFEELDSIFEDYDSFAEVDQKTKNLINTASIFLTLFETEPNEDSSGYKPKYNVSQINNLIKNALGIGNVVLDTEENGYIDILFLDHLDKTERDSLIDTWFTELSNARKTAYEKLEKDPTIVDKWKESLSKGATSSELTSMEGYSLFISDEIKEDLKSFLDKIYDFAQNTDQLEPAKLISSDVLDDLLNYLSNDLLKEGYNITEFIKDQIQKAKSQQNNYFINEEVLQKLENSKKILSTLSALVTGSDRTYRNDILDVPFGANIYLNEAFKDKKIELEFSLLNHSTTTGLQNILNNLNNSIDALIEQDRKNRGAVVTTEKQIGIKYAELKLQRIQQLFYDEEIDPALVHFRDLLGDWNFTITPVSEMSDEDYIDRAAVYRNKLLEFERKFYSYFSSLSDSDKMNFIKALAGKFNNIHFDTISIDVDILKSSYNSILTDSTFYWYLMSCSLGHGDQVLSSYKDIITDSDKFPFDSQEEIIIFASKFLLANEQSFNDIKLWMNYIDTYLENGSKSNDSNKNLNTVLKIICSGGTGKTSTIINYIYNIISKEIPNKKRIFAVNTIPQKETLKKSLGNNNEEIIFIQNLIDDLKSGNPDLIEKYKNSNIIVDECTNISLDELVEIDTIASKNNIRFLMLGDTKQYGNIKGIDFAICPMTIQLTESKRSLTNITRQNNSIFERLFSQTSDGHVSLKVTDLPNFEYFEDDSRFEGVKFDLQGGTKVLTLEYIKDFYDKYIKNTNKTLLVVTPNLDKLGSEIVQLSKDYNITFVDNIKDIQGSEWDYTITDWDLNIDGKLQKEYYDTYDKLRSIYTLFTRHRSGLVSLTGLTFKDLRFGQPGIYKVVSEGDIVLHNTKSNYSPIESGIFNNPKALEEFKEYKQAILDKINLVIEDNPEQEDSIKTKTNIVKISKQSLAQVAVGFVLKEEFDPNFIKTLNLGSQDYGEVRNILYMALTSPEKRADLLQLLPESLQNGKFLIEFRTSTVGDLVTFGNLQRDNKWLNGVHPWIVYKIGDKVLHLGMFHNAETSEISNSPMSKLSYIINNLPNGEKLYYNIPDNITFSRSQSIVDIQDRETNQGEYLDIHNQAGKLVIRQKSNDTEFMTLFDSTPTFYFRKKSNEAIVPVVKITTELDNISSLYREIFDLLNPNDPNSLFGNDVSEVKELLRLDRHNKKWMQRDTVKLNNRFVSFVTLKLPNNPNISTTQGLHAAALTYLNTLKSKKEQLLNILEVLKNNALSDDEKRTKIAYILSNKIMFNIVPLVYDPEMISNEEEFKKTISLLTTKNLYGSSRKRTAYNIAIIHQLGSVLTKVAAIKRFSEDLKLADSSDSYFDKHDASYLIKLWDNNKDKLLEACKTWYRGENVDKITEEILLSFFLQIISKVEKENGGYDFIDAFANEDGDNLLQTEAFKDFLWSLYSDKEWYDPNNIKESISYRINGLIYRKAKTKKEKEALSYFSEYTHPQLIKDNGINVLQNGDGITLTPNNNFLLYSKIAQPGRIFLYADDSISESSFTRYNIDSSNVSGVQETEKTQVEETKSLPESDNKSKFLSAYTPTQFTEKYTGINRSYFRQLGTGSDKQILGDLLTHIAVVNSELANSIYTDILYILQKHTLPENSKLTERNGIEDETKQRIINILKTKKILQINC